MQMGAFLLINSWRSLPHWLLVQWGDPAPRHEDARPAALGFTTGASLAAREDRQRLVVAT